MKNMNIFKRFDQENTRLPSTKGDWGGPTPPPPKTGSRPRPSFPCPFSYCSCAPLLQSDWNPFLRNANTTVNYNKIQYIAIIIGIESRNILYDLFCSYVCIYICIIYIYIYKFMCILWLICLLLN